MIKRSLIALILSPVWLLMSVIITILYSIGYVKGVNNVKDFNTVKKNNGMSINEADEFEVYAD